MKKIKRFSALRTGRFLGHPADRKQCLPKGGLEVNTPTRKYNCTCDIRWWVIFSWLGLIANDMS